MIDYKLALMTGVDIPIPEYQLVMHQPSIKEISMMGEKDFFIALQFLCLNKTAYIKDEVVLKQVTNFQIFMTVLHDPNVAKELNLSINLKDCVIQLLTLLFGDYRILFTPQSIIFNKMEDNKIIQNVLIDDSNFQVIQDIIKAVFCVNTNFLGDQGVFNPKGKRAQEVAEKLMCGRQRVAAQKGDSNESVFVRYLSVLSIGIPMDLRNLIELTAYQLYDLIERYGLFLDWDIDLKVRLAGGTPKTQAESFMKNIH